MEKMLSRAPTFSSLIIVAALFAFQVASPASLAAADAPKRPNIIIILSDDMGYSDLGCYGGEIATPTLDRLAQGGVRFTQFYNTGRCCPTRAALLTGLYPHQAGVGHMMDDRGHPGYTGNLNSSCRTIAEVLRPAGYRTYMTGKWHVTRHTQPSGPKHNWPVQRGFDRFYGTITGGGSFFDPGTLTRDNTMISPFADPEYPGDNFYYTDAISDHAARYITEHAKNHGDKPFFLYVAYTAAHWPMHAKESDIAKYKGKYDAGFDPIRKARHERMKKLGVIEPHTELSPQHSDWAKTENKAWESRNMEVYAAMIDSMDQGIARVVAALEKSQQLDNTLILFMQDNGGCQETIGRSGDIARPDKPTLPPIARDAIRLDVITKQDRAGFPTLMGPKHLAGGPETYIAYGIGWANVSNTPFREYKHFVHEGGISTPLIAHWPATIKRKGELEKQPGHLVDLMATCVEVAGANYPSKVGDHPITPMEGVSLLPAMQGKPLARANPIFWEHEGNRAVRDGKWKLVAKENKPWELYDLDADRAEMHDLAKEQPQRVKDLEAKWDAYAKRANVLPLGTWRGGNARAAEAFSRAHKFELKPGDELSRERAPHIVSRSLRVSAKLDEPGDGVIVAQGGLAHGYALHVQEGKPRVTIRRDNEATVLVGKDKLPAGKCVIDFSFSADGAATLSVDGKVVAKEKLGGPFKTMPVDGLQVGDDRGGQVGDYGGPSAFRGKVGGVTITLDGDKDK